MWARARIVADTVVAGVIAGIAVALRIWARRKTRQPLEADDYLAFSALVALIGLMIVPILVVCLQTNIATDDLFRDGSLKPPSHFFRVCTHLLEVWSPVPLTLSKISMLLFYRRIFRGTLMLAMVYTIISFTVIWCVTFFFAALFQCVPIDRYLVYGHLDPHVYCIDQFGSYYANATFDVILDLAIMIVPIPLVARLQMQTKQKLGLIFIFFLGTLTIAASITRLLGYITADIKVSEGIYMTYAISTVVYWTMVEASLSILCTCLPLLRPLFRNWSVNRIRDWLGRKSGRKDSVPKVRTREQRASKSLHQTSASESQINLVEYKSTTDISIPRSIREDEPFP